MDTNIQTIEQNIIAIEQSIHNIDIGTVTTIPVNGDGSAGIATASYNPTTSTLDLGIPVGANGSTGAMGQTGATGQTGLTGDSYTIDAEGTLLERDAHDTEAKSFSYLDIVASILYIKLSSVDGDWNSGAPFMRGEKGDEGEAGVNANDSVLVNGSFNINQRGFVDADFIPSSVGTYGPDMWAKESDTAVFQMVRDGKYKPNTTYVLSASDTNFNIVSFATTVIQSPSSGDWKVVALYFDPLLIGLVKLEEGTEPTPHNPLNDTLELLECRRYYIDNNVPITAAIIDSDMLVRRANISFPVTMYGIPTVTLKGSTNGLLATGIDYDGARLSATTTGGATLRAQCDGYIASIQ